MNFIASSILLATIMIAGEDETPPTDAPGFLDSQLRREDPVLLARDARRLGDARRGALVLLSTRPHVRRCHLSEDTGAAGVSGPRPDRAGKGLPDAELVESILEPSKTIKKGYETVTIVTDDGRTVSGLLAEDRPDAIVLRDPGQGGKPITISKKPDRTTKQSTGRRSCRLGW